MRVSNFGAELGVYEGTWSAGFQALYVGRLNGQPAIFAVTLDT
jgi:hypothetical protein